MFLVCFHILSSFQLDQINIALQTADDLTKLELYDLEKDLKELIAFTEGMVKHLRTLDF